MHTFCIFRIVTQIRKREVKTVNLTFADGVEHQAGTARLVGDVIYMNRMIHITKTIPSQGIIISDLNASGVTIPAVFRYVLLFNDGIAKVGVFGSGGNVNILTEDELTPGYWLVFGIINLLG